ncbi:MAG: DUF1553 domain-containing protein [Verrucomicrobiota bacterium]
MRFWHIAVFLLGVATPHGLLHISHAEEVDFARQILPILSDNCYRCHGPDANDRKADLRLDTAEGSRAHLPEVIERITSTDPDDLMPPPESHLKLTAEEIDLIEKWIESGGEYADHWAFVKPERPAVPESDAELHPIDAFVERTLQNNHLEFSEEAAPHRLIRRVTLDLTGLPPTPAEVSSFVKDYAERGDLAYSALVDRLLDSPRYGEHMALGWLDAARYADTDGYQFDGPREMWRWRDWVIEAYNRNLPFDQFTIEQLAGDLLPNPTLDQKIATGFNRNHRYNSEEGLVIEEFLLENAVDRVDTMSTIWMGLTVGCARCHDHKYDPISQKDYYQLIAYFNSIGEAGRALKQGNSEPLIIAPTREQQTELKRQEQKLAELKAAIKPQPVTEIDDVLIDRDLVHRFALDDTLPEENAQLTGETKIASGALQLDSSGYLKLSAIDKSINARADAKYTVSFWVKPHSLDDATLFSRQSSGRKGMEAALVEDGRVQFDINARWISSTGRATSKQRLPINEWTHITLVNDGSSSANGQLIYFNGQRVETTITHNTNSNPGGVSEKEPVLLGFATRHGAKKFTGAMRDLRLYKVQLWPEEIAVLGGDEKQRHSFAAIKASSQYAAYAEHRTDLEKYVSTLPTVMVMQETPEPKITHLRERGVYDAYGEVVQRRVPEKLPAMNEDLPNNRLGLAKWLVSPEHPLTARVTVNRYWQRYFGTGLVKTPEDFGVQSPAPSHPELLDWLAMEFIESGWDVAAMQKLIVTSRTYRQRSHMTSDHRERDPDNRLLARGPRMRLSGQAIRDQALFTSGLLVEKLGGPSVSPYQPANLWREMSMGRSYKQSKGDALYRRSLYTIWKRTVAPPTMSVFDSADREACWVSIKETNTPLQALTLLNEKAYIESARNLASRMLKAEEPIAFAYQTVLSRPPTPEEQQLLNTALTEYQANFQANPDSAKELIAVGESKPPADLDPIQLAAHTALANVILNLDETITKE